MLTRGSERDVSFVEEIPFDFAQGRLFDCAQDDNLRRVAAREASRSMGRSLHCGFACGEPSVGMTMRFEESSNWIVIFRCRNG